MVPQKFTKIKVVDGKIENEEFVVQARKIALSEISKNFLEKHNNCLRIQNDEYYNNIAQEEVIGELKIIKECADNFNNISFDDLCLKLKKLKCMRHLCTWHDGSSIANHGHLMIMVNVIYEPTIFYTNDEYPSVFKEKVDIQREVVKSVLYLLASCPADDTQLMYNNTRMENIIDLSNSLG